jgi:membrane protein implicated in regulation of membrane protease activity
MQPALAWLLMGLVLVVVELLTGTFYLLILGIAAGVGSLVAWLGGPFWIQALLASVAAVAGSIMVRRSKSGAATASGNSLDVGQTVVLESWVSEPQRLAKVRYRDATWDAEVLGEDPVEPGAVLYVSGTDGNRLEVSTARAA